jgi:phosphoglycerate dehydrogenase-like enzyme
MLIKVATVAFSKNAHLVDTLQKEFPDAVVNTEGIRLSGDELVNYLTGADGVIVGLENITGDILDKIPTVKVISKFGVGLDNIDLEACRQRNIPVGWTGGVNRHAVAEMSLGFMLMLLRNLYVSSNQLKQAAWNKNGGTSLYGKTVGIIGLGHIGQELVSLLAPFHCTILANDTEDRSAFAAQTGIELVPKEKLYAESDIISLHTPLTALTRNLMNLAVFSRMKPGAFLINTARGGIVNEADLKQALVSGMIAGAALDVYETEPPTDRELLSLPNLVCTPHTGGNSNEAVLAMGLSAIEHMVHFRDHQNVKK